MFVLHTVFAYNTNMKRDIFVDLLEWKNNLAHKPLLLRGARQVGKTFTVRDFAKTHFSNCVEINFELQPELKKIFNTLDATEIIGNLTLALGVKIENGSTLIFFDEIQECPAAISALRYFYEQHPQLHVIGAGSLLEFTLAATDFRMPVGRIEYLYLEPLSFGEFLLACGEGDLRQYLANLTLKLQIHEVVHTKLLHLFRNYLLVGGMPEVITAYLAQPQAIEFQNTQLSLLQTYRDDFGKYASRARHGDLQNVFNTAAALVGKIYKYTQVNPDKPSRDIKEALHLLTQAGVIHKVLATSAHGLPFIKDTNEKKFKILFLDVGLMQRSLGLHGQLAFSDDFLSIHSGSVAEQYVGQELMNLRNRREAPILYFWAREQKNSQAEIDYLTAFETTILPIEVKAGKTGRLKSLKLFLQENVSPFGIRFSQLPLSYHEQVLSIPIYAVSQMPTLVKELL